MNYLQIIADWLFLVLSGTWMKINLVCFLLGSSLESCSLPSLPVSRNQVVPRRVSVLIFSLSLKIMSCGNSGL